MFYSLHRDFNKSIYKFINIGTLIFNINFNIFLCPLPESSRLQNYDSNSKIMTLLLQASCSDPYSLTIYDNIKHKYGSD